MKPSQRIEIDFVQVLGRAQDGDTRAQEQLFERFYPTVERMVHHHLARDIKSRKPWLTARFSTGDVVQEVFRSVLGDLSSFQGANEGAFAGYLSRIVQNRILDTIRFHEASRRDGRRHSRLAQELDPGSGAAGPATQAGESEEVELYREALGEFSEREQRLLTARIEGDVTFLELASELGYSSEAATRRAFYSAQAQLLILLRKLRDTQG